MSKRLVFALSLAIVAAVFAIGITNGHIGLDDWGYTEGCPFVAGGLSFANVGTAFSETGYGAIWMPLTFISYMMDFSFFGCGWSVHHTVNVVLHLVNFVLVFMVLRMLLRRFTDDSRQIDFACLIATLFWAVHPMRAEAVTYIAGRKEELWSLFALLGMLAYARFADGGKWLSYAASLVCFVLSAMAKPTAIAFPLLVAVVHFLRSQVFFGRGVSSWQGRPRPCAMSLWQGRPRPCAMSLWQGRPRPCALIPFFIGALALAALTAISQTRPSNGATAELFAASYIWCLLNAAVSFGLYLWHTVCPLSVHMDYRAVFDGWPVDGCLGLAALLVATAAFVLVLRRGSERVRRAVVVSALLFVFPLLPTLGIFGYVNGDQAMADRYTYLPSVGASLLIALVLMEAFKRGKVFRRLVAIGCLVVVCAEVALLSPVIRSFESDAALYSRVLSIDGEHWRALRVVGNEKCAREGRMDEGLAMLRKSLALRPSKRTADSLAYILAERGRPEDRAEVRRLGAAIAANPRLDDGGMMLDALGRAAMLDGDYALAIRYFEFAWRAPRRQHTREHIKVRLEECRRKLRLRRGSI